MKAKLEYAIALVTTPDLKTARKLARAVLEARLAACVNIIPEIESHYWWDAKIQSEGETLLLFKTSSKRLAALEKCILALHPYDTPEFVVLQIKQGNRRYLDWLCRSTTPHAARGTE
jgi:periplasmic divalent cation tolerance protein